MLDKKIGFIGAGQMATALGRGFVGSGLISSGDLQAVDPDDAARQHFVDATGGVVGMKYPTAIDGADILFLAVKPQYLLTVANDLKGKIPSDTLLVSIVAGVRLSTLADLFGSKMRIVRVMPNTPCLVGQGACGFCPGDKATKDDAELVKKLLSAVGKAFQVEEKLIDAITGLSGSGPAFVYMMIEALSDAGVRAGLPRTTATALAAQTLHGASAMVIETGEHPAVLKDRVTSPAGTTIAGVQALEQGGLRAALMSAVEAATKRAAELGS